MNRTVTDVLIAGCFNANFGRSYNVQLIGGAEEPLYLAADGDRSATIRYTRDYARSALHEIAHWCLAGGARRRLMDYGYWYSPPPRNAPAQRAFCTAEVAVQALEQRFCQACGVRFTVSLDNLDGAPELMAQFSVRVACRVRELCRDKMTGRANRMVELLRTLAPGPSRRMSPLYLFDGTLLFFRALYGVPDVFVDSRDRSVNGVRGYLQYLLATLGDNEVRYAAVAFDESLNTCWRNEFYPEYKANRPPADTNILFQLTLCRTLTEACGVSVLADLRYEADDIIATLATRARRDVVIISRDKDLQQLLSEKVSLLEPGSDNRRTSQDFTAKEGFAPNVFPDYQALTGDSIDNVPGVRAVGAKTAGKLVRSLGALENIYAQRERWPQTGIKATSRVAINLVAERERAFLFRRILRLERNAELAYSMSATRFVRPKRRVVAAVLDKLGLQRSLGSVLSRFAGEAG